MEVAVLGFYLTLDQTRLLGHTLHKLLRSSVDYSKYSTGPWLSGSLVRVCGINRCVIEYSAGLVGGCVPEWANCILGSLYLCKAAFGETKQKTHP